MFIHILVYSLDLCEKLQFDGKVNIDIYIYIYIQ